MAKSLKIRTEYLILGFFPALVSLSVVFILLFANRWYESQSQLKKELATKMALLNSELASILQSGDPQAAQAIFKKIHNIPNIAGISLYDASGKPFAHYQNGNQTVAPPKLLHAEDDAIRSQSDFVQFTGQITDQNRQWGSIWIGKQANGLFGAMPILIVLFLSLSVACLASAYFARRLHMGIFRPICQMAGTLQQITLEGDYSKRVQIKTSGSLGLLVDNFNHLLENLETLHVQEDEALIRKRINKLKDILGEDQCLSQLSLDICAFMCRKIGANFAAFYRFEEDNKLYMKGKYGFPVPASMKRCYQTGEGWVGQAAMDRAPRIIKDVPLGYFPDVPGMGQIVPEALLVFPFMNKGNLEGILELAFLKPCGPDVMAFLNRGHQTIAHSISQVSVSETMQVLLKRSQSPTKTPSQEVISSPEAGMDAAPPIASHPSESFSSQAGDLTSATAHSLKEGSHTPQNQPNTAPNGHANQMSAIHGLARLLEREQLPQNARRMVGLIRSAIEIPGNDFDSNQEKKMDNNGVIPSSAASFELPDVLDKLARFMSLAAGSKDLEMLIGPVPSAAQVLKGSKTTLMKVLEILAGHAILFAESGEVIVNVQEVQTSETQNKVLLRFSVKEACPRASKSKREGIFKAFSNQDHQGGGPEPEHDKWSACSRLVASLGGQLMLNIQEPTGIEFSFEAWFQIGRKVSTPLPKMTHLSILIADDNPAAREVMAETALSLGWFPTVVGSGAAVLEALAMTNNAFDAILLDWKMPGMDGFAVAQKILEAGPENPPIILMAKELDVPKLRAMDTGKQLDCILTKPVTSARLYHAVLEAKNHLLDALVKKACISHGQRLGDMSILVVDDHEITRDVAKEILEKEGAAVVGASNSELACSILRKFPEKFDVILMDLEMPQMKGIESASCFRDTPALMWIPIVGLTCNPATISGDNPMPAEIDALVVKPLETEKLVEVVLQLTGKLTQTHKLNQEPVDEGIPEAYYAMIKSFSELDIRRGLEQSGWNWRQYESNLLKFAKNHYFYAMEVLDGLSRKEWHPIKWETSKLCAMAKSIGSESIPLLILEMEKAIESRDPHHIFEVASSLDREIIQIADVVHLHLPTKKRPIEGDPHDFGMEELLQKLQQFTQEALSKNVACCSHLEVFREVRDHFPGETDIPRMFQSIEKAMAYYDFEAVTTTSAALIEKLERYLEATAA